MPRSSRHKSKRSVKEGREYSDTEEDVSKGKRREGKESGSGSGEKRKLASQSVVVKDSAGHGNGYSSEEYVGSKKRKDRSDKVGSDRWNGSGEVLGVESEIREESSQFDDKVLKSKGVIDLKSKISSARHDGETKEENVDLFVGKEESISGKVESKRRLERDISEKEKHDRDLNRKDDYKIKDAREREKGSERDNNKSVDSKRDLDYRAVDREEPKGKKVFEDWFLEDEYGKHKSEKEDDRRRKKRTDESDEKDKYQDHDRDGSDINVMSRRDRVKDGTDRDERHKDITIRDKHYWPLEEVYGKHESEKERETRRRKRTGESDDKDKYQEDNKDSNDINVTSRRERNKDGRDRDERHKDISSRDKNRDYYDRDSKSRDVDKREGTDRERTQKYDEYSDDRVSRDHVGSKNDSKYVRDEFDSLNSRQKKSRIDTSNFDCSIMYEDQSSRYKDYKETRGSTEKKEYGDMKPRGAKEYLDSANKSAGAKEETVSERERSLSFHPDESTAGKSRRKRSPSSTALGTRDQYRHPKPSDTKYRESLPDERFRSNLNYGKEGNGSGVYDRAHSSRAIDKSIQKGDSSHVADLSSERHRVTDRRVSPARLADKSQSPSSAERRHLSRIGDQRSHDYEDSGHRSSGYKDPNYHYYDGKRSQDRKMETPSMDASSQVDEVNMHVSSSFSRSARIPGNARSFLPTASPLKHGVDSSYAGSAEEDGRGKLNNHPKRSVDSSMGRMQGNVWWGAPNWPSSMGNGYLPFPHGPAAVGFHPMMQQFPPHMFGARPPMDHSGVPFIPDGDRFPGYGRPFGWPNPMDETCPSPMPNWDSNNMVPGEGFTQGRLDWDQNRNLTASASREPSIDRYKGANSVTMESPSGNRRATAEPIDDLSSQSNPGLKNEPFHSDHQVDKAGYENQFGSKLSSDMSAPCKEISGRMSNAKVLEEGKKYVDIDDHVHRSCAYLSKIDISAHLAPSDLFDQCMSLLGIKQSTLSDTMTSRFSLEEENEVEGESTKMNSYISHVPVFAEVSDSLLEKAMSIYRQHRDDTTVNYSSSTSVGNHPHQSPNIQCSEPSSLAPSQLGEAKDHELVCPGPLSEFRASSINEDKDTTPIIHPKLEAPSTTSCDNISVGVSNQPEVPISTVSSSEEVKEELVSVVDRQVTESTAGDADEKNQSVEKTNTDLDEGTRIQSPNILTTCNAEAKYEANTPVEEGDDDGNKETNDALAATETTTGDPTLPSTTDVHFEGCEDTMITELNECGSVNLSRIH